MAICPKCKSRNIRSGLVGKDRLMRTYCGKCGFIIEQEGYGELNQDIGKWIEFKGMTVGSKDLIKHLVLVRIREDKK